MQNPGKHWFAFIMQANFKLEKCFVWCNKKKSKSTSYLFDIQKHILNLTVSILNSAYYIKIQPISN